MSPDIITLKVNANGQYVGGSVRMDDGELVTLGKDMKLAHLLEAVDPKDLRRLHKAISKRIQQLDGNKKPWYKW